MSSKKPNQIRQQVEPVYDEIDRTGYERRLESLTAVMNKSRGSKEYLQTGFVPRPYQKVMIDSLTPDPSGEVKPLIQKFFDAVDPARRVQRHNPALNTYMDISDPEMQELMDKPIHVQFGGRNPERTFDKFTEGFSKIYQHEWEETFVDIAMRPSMFDRTLVIHSMSEHDLTGKDHAALKIAEGGFKKGDVMMVGSNVGKSLPIDQVMAGFQPRPYQKSMIQSLAARGYFAASDTMKHYVGPEFSKGSPPTLSLIGVLIKRLFRPKPFTKADETLVHAIVEAERLQMLSSFAMQHGLMERGLVTDTKKAQDAVYRERPFLNWINTGC